MTIPRVGPHSYRNLEQIHRLNAGVYHKEDNVRDKWLIYIVYSIDAVFAIVFTHLVFLFYNTVNLSISLNRCSHAWPRIFITIMYVYTYIDIYMYIYNILYIYKTLF